MKKLLLLLFPTFFLYSCGNSIEQRAFAASESAVKAKVDGQPYEIRNSEVVFKTDSDCVTYFTFHYQGKDIELEHLYTIKADSTIWENISNRNVLQSAEKKYAELLEKNNEDQLKKEKRDLITITRVYIGLSCVLSGHKIE